ncbi:hypothetical protein [Bdellovibrio bacteriovorus]|uniref:hypothetical protein n=1 Tax=Bdellovibrio TaxID=958 RepID=UPI0035A8A505
MKRIFFGLILGMMVVAGAMAANRYSKVSSLSTVTFSDGTTVETIVTSGNNPEKWSQVYQIKQSNGVVCYGIAELANNFATNPTISCTK